MDSLLFNTFALCVTVGLLMLTFGAVALGYVLIRGLLIDEGIIKEKPKNKKDI